MNKKQQMGLMPEQHGRNAIGELSVEHIDGKYILALHPNTYRCNDNEFMEVFASLPESCAAVASPHVLRPERYVDGDNGGFCLLASKRFIPLGQFLADKPQAVADESWTRNFVDDLLDALESLHKQGLAAVELTSMSVLVRKGNPHDLMLMPPASPFLPLKDKVWTRANEYLAPELLAPFDDRDAQADEPTTNLSNLPALDIYAAAQLLKRLFKFSQLPPEYMPFVSAASSADISSRPQSVEQVKAMISRTRRKRSLVRLSMAILAGIGIIGLFLWGLQTPDTGSFQQLPSPVADTLYQEHIEPDTFSILFDETEFVLPDSAISRSAATDTTSVDNGLEAEHRRVEAALNEFRRRYAVKVREALAPVYTHDNLVNGSQTAFQQRVVSEMGRLQEQAYLLAHELNLDFTLAQSEAVLVLSSVTSELKNEAMNEAAGSQPSATGL